MMKHKQNLIMKLIQKIYLRTQKLKIITFLIKTLILITIILI